MRKLFSHPVYSITNVAKTRLEMLRMEIRITNVCVIAHLDDNSGVQAILLRIRPELGVQRGDSRGPDAHSR